MHLYLLSKLFLGLALVLCCGSILVGFLDRKKSLCFAEKTAISFLAGEGILTTILFWSFFINLHARIYFIGIIILLFFVLKNFPLRPLIPQLPKIRPNPKHVLIGLLLIGILFKLSFSFIETLSKPEYSWDATGNWTLTGKIYHYVSENYPNQITWALKNTNNYPKMIQLMHFWLFSWMGEANDQWSKIIFPLELLSFLAVFYFNVRRFRGRLGSLFFSYLLLSTPFFLYHSTIGYAGMTIAIFLSTGIIYFYRFVNEKKDVYFYLFSIFFAMTTWIKLEGKTLFIMGLLLLSTYLWKEYHAALKEKMKKIMQYLSLYIVFGLPWQLFAIFNQMASREKLAFNLGYFVPMHQKMYLWLFTQGTWGIFWAIFFVSLVLFYKNIPVRKNYYLLLSVFLFYGIMLFAYLFTYDAYAFFESAFNRSWHLIYPTAVFTIACLVPKMGEE